MTPAESPRRQARLSTKVLITWSAMLAAWAAHRIAPEHVSELLPLVIYAVSRLFLWPAFPGAGQKVLNVFLAALLLILIPLPNSSFSLIGTVVWALVTVASILFLLMNDLAHVYWRIRESRRKAP